MLEIKPVHLFGREQKPAIIDWEIFIKLIKFKYPSLGVGIGNGLENGRRCESLFKYYFYLGPFML